MSAGWLLNGFRSTYNHITGYNAHSCLFIQARDYAARRGTREKAKKKKVKVVVEKVGFIPHNIRAAKKAKAQVKVSPLRRIVDDWKIPATDNVWIVKYHQQPIYGLKEALECHRETHHPTMYNKPDAHVKAFIELDMQREKKTKVLDKFTRLVDTPYAFQTFEDRSILAFCKTSDGVQAAKDAGASFVGGTELIKQIQAGDFPYKEYNYVVAHTDILPDLLLIRGLLKRKFPNVKTGNLGNHMDRLVTKFKEGIQYSAIPMEDHKQYGQIDVVFGTLNMDIKQLEENFSALIKDILVMKPKREEPFILRAQIGSEPSPEMLKIDLEEYLPKKPETKAPEEDNTSAVIEMH
ncbi:mitochondrial ribosomal protein L1 [Andrena cerasifolii]|uniref:mitochondrial ribosomal protein L1 n=1 Tax=Andrena cerasifolii TaxID=2819439 RepID=UPI004037929A